MVKKTQLLLSFIISFHRKEVFDEPEVAMQLLFLFYKEEETKKIRETTQRRKRLNMLTYTV